MSAAAQPDSDAAAAILRLQARMLSCEHFEAAAIAFTVALCAEAGYQRVSFATFDRGAVRVRATSDRSLEASASDEMRRVAAAMEEALAQGETICIPDAPGKVVTLAHDVLSRHGGCAVCTVPVAVSGVPAGAVTVERAGVQVWSEGEVRLLEHVVSLAAPLLDLLERANRPWHVRLRNTIGRSAASVKSSPRLRLAWAVSVLAVVLAVVVPVDRQVAGRARIEGAVQRVLVAPTDGFVQTANVRPGDRVIPGQVLAELADRELQLERLRWAGQVAQHENAYVGAAARADRATTAINLAKAAEAQASLDLVEIRLARTRVEAPFEAIVIQGDLSQSVGAPVKQGDTLLTIARTDAFRALIEVDERDIRPVRAGQLGTLALSALPWKSLPLEVTRLTPIAETVDGANVFEVEAKLLEHPGDLRPGLRGVAKITAGKQPILVGWTRRIVDWLRLWTWTLLA